MMIDLTFSMDNGDCVLIHNEDNMIAACTRRLNTVLDTTLYQVYGSTLDGLIGFKKSDVNLQFINQTVYDCLMQDTRITDCAVNSEYIRDGFRTNITILYEDNELNFDYVYDNGDMEE